APACVPGQRSDRRLLSTNRVSVHRIRPETSNGSGRSSSALSRKLRSSQGHQDLQTEHILIEALAAGVCASTLATIRLTSFSTAPVAISASLFWAHQCLVRCATSWHIAERTCTSAFAV